MSWGKESPYSLEIMVNDKLQNMSTSNMDCFCLVQNRTVLHLKWMFLQQQRQDSPQIPQTHPNTSLMNFTPTAKTGFTTNTSNPPKYKSHEFHTNSKDRIHHKYLKPTQIQVSWISHQQQRQDSPQIPQTHPNTSLMNFTPTAKTGFTTNTSNPPKYKSHGFHTNSKDRTNHKYLKPTQIQVSWISHQQQRQDSP